MKICSRCKKEKSLSEFGKNRSRIDGFSTWCRLCTRESSRRSYAKYKKARLAIEKQSRERNPNYYKEKDRNNYWRNRETIRARNARYYANHSDDLKRKATRWKKKNPEKSSQLHRSAQSARRARKLDQFIEDVNPIIVYQMHGGMCGICKNFVSQDDFHVDHIIPLAKGGMHGYINVQPAHPKCNLHKGAKVEVS